MVAGAGGGRSGDGIHGAILEAGLGSPGTILAGNLPEAGRCRPDVGSAASGAGAVQSRAAGTEEGFPRRRTSGETTGGSGANPQGCDGGLTETMRPTGPLCHRRSQEDKERSGAAIVSLACSARSEMQSGDLGCEGLQ